MEVAIHDSILNVAWDFYRGRHLRRPDVAVATVERVEIRASAQLAVQLDGDPQPISPPMTLELSPRPLKLLAPRPASPAHLRSHSQGR